MGNRMLFGALSLVLATGALAHSGATGIVRERMDAMEAIGQAAKTLVQMSRGSSEYSADEVRSAASAIKAHSGEAMLRLFPAGTNPAPSEALDEIWSDWDDFAILAGRMEILSGSLVSAAGNGMGGDTAMVFDPAMTGDDLAALPVDTLTAMIGRTCAECHRKFRVEK